MATVSININNDGLAKLQLATYSVRPDLFPDGTPVILNRTTDAVLLASDGTGLNYLQLTDSQLNTLINTGKPATDVAIQTMTTDFWNERRRTARQTRRNYRESIATDPMD